MCSRASLTVLATAHSKGLRQHSISSPPPSCPPSQRRALVRRWRQSLGLEEAETWAAMGASGLGPGLRSLAPSTFNPRLERALVACGGGGEPGQGWG